MSQQPIPAPLAGCYFLERQPRTQRLRGLAGVGVGLAVLYLTLVTFPNALGIHGAIWSIVANFATCIAVSSFTKPPSDETIGRIHGAIEELVYGVDVQTPRDR